MGFILPAIALMTLLASCSAWRKSPLFSLKTTVNLVGATVLIIALIVGITQWHLSLDAQIIVLPLLVVAVEIFGTALLIRVSDSHIARLPSSVKPLTVYRQKAFQWIWRLLVFLLVCTAATLILPSSWRWLPSGLGGFVLLISCPMLTALYMRARRLDFGMSQVTSRPWVHWQYSPEQWIAWTNSQFERERSQVQPFSWNRDGRKYLKATLVFGLPLFIGCWLAGDETTSFKLEVGSAMTTAVMLLFVGMQQIDRHKPQRQYRRMLSAPPEAYLGDEGLFCNGEYSQWIFSGS